MKLEWDEVKARANVQKHGVTFEVASLVFKDRNAIDDLDADVAEEDRWKRLGMVQGRILLVVYTETRKGFRMISARKATRDEEARYYRR